MLWLLLCLIRVHQNLFDVPTKKVVKYSQIYPHRHRRKRGVGEMWEESIYPGMKKAVISAVQSCQEIVEYRKVKWCLLYHKHSKQQHCILAKHDITETFVECTPVLHHCMSIRELYGKLAITMTTPFSTFPGYLIPFHLQSLVTLPVTTETLPARSSTS